MLLRHKFGQEMHKLYYSISTQSYKDIDK